MTEKIGVDITANVSSLDQGYNQAEKRTKEFANTVEKANADITGASQKAINALGQVGKEIVTGDFSQIPETLGRAALSAPSLALNLATLVAPFAAVAAAAGIMGKAFYDGNKESVQLSNALILTGNAAGTTVDRLYDIANAIADSSGFAKSEIASAMTQLIRAGGVAEQSLGMAAEAAVRLEKAGVQAIDKTVQQFSALGKDPVEASYRLNQQYNYLTAAVYEQIKALADEGKQREAAALAMRTYDEATQQMTEGVSNNLGYIARGWNAITQAITEAKSKAMDWGRAQSLTEQIAELDRKIAIGEKTNKATNSNPAFANFYGNNAQLEQWRQDRAGLMAAMAAQEESTALAKNWNQVQQDGIAKLREKESARRPAHAAEIDDGKRLLEQLERRLMMTENLTAVEMLLYELESGKKGKITEEQRASALAFAAQIDQRALIKAQLDEELSAAQKVRKEYEAQENQLQQLIGATPTGKNTARMQKEALAESALLSGKIDQKTFDEILKNLNEVKKEGEDTFGALTSAINQWGRASAEAMVDFVFTGKASFSDLANSIIKDIARIVIQQNVTNKLAESVASLKVSDFSGLFASFFHTGGVAGVDSGSATRALPADLFTTAPRYHTGAIAGDEQPAVLKKGEGVFTEAQMKKLAPASGSGTTVNIINQAQGTEITQNRRQGAGGENILDVVIRTVRSNLLNDVAVGGEFASGLEGQYNLSRVAGG